MGERILPGGSWRWVTLATPGFREFSLSPWKEPVSGGESFLSQRRRCIRVSVQGCQCPSCKPASPCLAGLLASPQSAPGNLDNGKNGESRGNGGNGGSRENSTAGFSKVTSVLCLSPRCVADRLTLCFNTHSSIYIQKFPSVVSHHDLNCST